MIDIIFLLIMLGEIGYNLINIFLNTWNEWYPLFNYENELDEEKRYILETKSKYFWFLIFLLALRFTCGLIIFVINSINDIFN